MLTTDQVMCSFCFPFTELSRQRFLVSGQRHRGELQSPSSTQNFFSGSKFYVFQHLFMRTLNFDYYFGFIAQKT